MVTGPGTPRKGSGGVLLTSPRKCTRKATPKKMTPRKELGKTTLRGESKVATPRRDASKTISTRGLSNNTPRRESNYNTQGRESRINTPRRDQFRNKVINNMEKKVELGDVQKIQTLQGVPSIKINDGQGRIVGGNGDGLSRNQSMDNMIKENSEDQMPVDIAVREGIEVTLENDICERENKVEEEARALELKEKEMEEVSRALELREKQVEVREVQVTERESELAKSRQNIKNIKNIIDEKQLLSRKVYDMEVELQAEKASRKEAERQLEEAEEEVQKMTLRLKTSRVEEEQVKSELMAQCQILGSQLEIVSKEVEKSEETVERLSLEWRRIAEGGKESKDDPSSKKKDEISMLTPEACPSGKEISDQDVEDVMGVVMGVSGVAGRKQGETLDLLRIQEEGEETPMSGSRMDFGEKKIFFQKKIEDQITSPSLRDRK